MSFTSCCFSEPLSVFFLMSGVQLPPRFVIVASFLRINTFFPPMPVPFQKPFRHPLGRPLFCSFSCTYAFGFFHFFGASPPRQRQLGVFFVYVFCSELLLFPPPGTASGCFLPLRRTPFGFFPPRPRLFPQGAGGNPNRFGLPFCLCNHSSNTFSPPPCFVVFSFFSSATFVYNLFPAVKFFPPERLFSPLSQGAVSKLILFIPLFFRLVFDAFPLPHLWPFSCRGESGYPSRPCQGPPHPLRPY